MVAALSYVGSSQAAATLWFHCSPRSSITIDSSTDGICAQSISIHVHVNVAHKYSIALVLQKNHLFFEKSFFLSYLIPIFQALLTTP